MESWCFDSLEKSYVSNETVIPRNILLGWDMKAPYSCCDNGNILVADNTLAYPTDEGIAEILARQYDCKNAPLQHEYNVVSKLGASSMADSNSRDLSSLIDLKLGGVSDHNLNSSSPGGGGALPVASSPEASTPAKRARAASSLSCQTAYCQVFGCNKDLSSAKDYHKRHKVCDVHSKTARVVVNGIEQRFCQQCSRFHLLAEFDDGKRSCRKRLAGHNERRRKPQVGFGGNRTGRSLHSYSGSISSMFKGTALAATSFICQDILGSTHGEKYSTNSWNKDIKIEDGASVYGQLGQKTILPPYLFGKQYTSVLDNGVYTENINHYPHETVSHSLFQTNSLGSEDLTHYDTESAVQGFPAMSESGCALSLLSPQSHNSRSSNASVIQSSCPHFGMTQVYGSQGLTAKNFPNTLPMLDDDDVDFANGTVHGLSCEDGTTIDLLQLSSQIQCVDNQRQTGPVKQDNGRFLLS